MKTNFTSYRLKRRMFFLLSSLFFILIGLSSNAQLGVYSFTGAGACPNQNPNVTTQPANAVLSVYSTSGGSLACYPTSDVYEYRHWNQNNSIDPTEYNQFSITANTNYTITLTSLSFAQFGDQYLGSTAWILRSSIDNYATSIASGTVTTISQTPTVNLPAADFTNINAVTFRLYIINAGRFTVGV